VFALSAALLLASASGFAQPERSGRRPPATQESFEVFEATVSELQEAMRAGRTDAQQLVQSYLARIRAYDPWINAMIALNPNAPEDARRLDEERAAGRVRGPLHGIPIVLKDNFDTAGIPTAAGSTALAGYIPPDDAFQVRRLKEAGCIILGKTNMHELACGITTISSLGGQTHNPYDPHRNPGGSSGGTGAAVAASFAAFGMGSDTCGSIRIPSSHHSLVGLRSTHGLASLDGVIPLSHTQDVAGPLARTVTDLALALDATAGEDPADPATRWGADAERPRFTAALNTEALRGARLGVLQGLFGEASEDQEVARIVQAAADEMGKLGATVSDLVIPDLLRLMGASGVIDHEFRSDLGDYLGRSQAPVRSLGEILEKGLFHAMLERTFQRRNAAPGPDSEEYRQALARREELQAAVLAAMDREGLDALLYPTVRRKAAVIGESQGGSTCQLSAATGFPALTLPAGFTDDGLPVGVELLGRARSDARLVAFGYAFEQATHHRRAPARTPALTSGGEAAPLSWEVTAAGEVSVPAVETSATARIRLTFDSSRNLLSYSLSLSGLREEEVLYATLQRGEKGKNGPVVALLSRSPFTTLAGELELSNELRGDLESARLYLNVASRLHRAGEVRAQLVLPEAQPKKK